MACISTDGLDFMAISVKNKLKILKNNVSFLCHINISVLKEDKQQVGDGGINFICHAFSLDKVFFAALTENKKLLVWDLSRKEDQLIMTIDFPKRPTAISFLNKENAIIVSDKYGDVYKCVITADSPAPPILTLGHLSMVLDVKVTEDDKYLISADRDEKIRVSFYPNAYSIHTYCLGHKNLVSCVKTLSDNKLVSISGDRTVKLWDYTEGKELSSIDLKKETKQESLLPSQLLVHGNDVILIAEKSQKVVFLEVNGTTLTYTSSHDLQCQPVDICCTTAGDVYVLCTSRENPVRKLSKNNNGYYECAAQESISKELQEWIEDLPTDSEITCFTNLVKPVRGKRDASALITPEATINFEGAYESSSKIMKIDEEKESKMEE